MRNCFDVKAFLISLKFEIAPRITTIGQKSALPNYSGGRNYCAPRATASTGSIPARAPEVQARGRGRAGALLAGLLPAEGRHLLRPARCSAAPVSAFRARVVATLRCACSPTRLTPARRVRFGPAAECGGDSCASWAAGRGVAAASPGPCRSRRHGLQTGPLRISASAIERCGLGVHPSDAVQALRASG